MADNTLKRAIELCLAAYRITDKFPEGEALKQKIRVLSIDIIECLVYDRATPTSTSRFFNCQSFEQKIRVLFTYFAVAEKQGWVDPRNFEVLSRAYKDFHENVRGLTPHILTEKPAGFTRSQTSLSTRQARLPVRQAKIVEFLRNKEGGSAISDIAKFIEASNKTAERDLKKLISAGRVEKQGNTKGARFLVIMDN